ncbi:uncharacterized protein M421DRAFT_422344 [Didymella exigua CBS 183.55]|uniref:Uncharacterized protein n=1 Tax=Didymella exigua CBS 183.55 TaxID=1150837 RepID=A0A6A5RJZ8_9PLEO|nr:uncharacterized protein M421DRAFT_422344 [Didymella exigua CBS 183.55]KAF1926746.1 hypothetical protein M421DRAFT_422344 [Didymella exigua CBS 183.55]
MASAEYYLGSQAVQQNHNQHPPAPYPHHTPPRPQYQKQQQPLAQSWKQQQYPTPSYANTPPPSYSPHAPQHEKQQMQTYPSTPPPQQQYPGHGYRGAAAPYFPPPSQHNGMLGPPLQHVRSHSQPAGRVQFADQESTVLGSESDSDSAPSQRRRRRRRRSRDRICDYEHSRDVDRGFDYSDRDYERSRGHRTKSHQKKHDNRDTFLGAGAGGIIGDVIFPGLGTAAGLIIGGLGGRKYAKDKERSQSEEGCPHRHRDAFREGREEGREDREHGRHRHRNMYYEGKEDKWRDKARDSGYGHYDLNSEEYEGHKHRGQHRKYGQQGWDKGSATFKSGTAVR